jgi:hypothetical protein
MGKRQGAESMVAADVDVSSVLAPGWGVRWRNLKLRRVATATKQDIPPSPPLGDELLDRLMCAVGAGDLQIVEVNRAFDAVAHVVVGPPALGEPKQALPA